MFDQIPIGQKIALPGHFDKPVIIEGIREITGGYELRVRLSDGSLDEAILLPDELISIAEQASESPETRLADADNIRLLIESDRFFEIPAKAIEIY